MVADPDMAHIGRARVCASTAPH